jgi:hypothetical protein
LTEQAWKGLQRRIARAWGGQPAWIGDYGSDGNNNGRCPVALEVKRSKRGTPLGAWIVQAKAQGHHEHKPWLLVVAGHNDRAPIAVCDHAWVLDLYRKAHGLLAEPVDLPAAADISEDSQERRVTPNP